jgi:hypothetical protein
MKGVRITHKEPHRSQRHEFSYNFGCLGGRLAELHWYADAFDTSPFIRLTLDDTSEAEIDSYRLRHPSVTQGLMFSPGVLPRFIEYLDSDWLTIVGLADTDPAALAEFAQSFRKSSGYSWAPLARCCFFNVDGAFWEFYSALDDDIETVVRSLHERLGVECTIDTLETRDLIFSRP